MQALLSHQGRLYEILKHLGWDDAITARPDTHRVASSSQSKSFTFRFVGNPYFACLNFLIHIDLDMDANPFPLEDRPVHS
jgi:hypothetical protein